MKYQLERSDEDGDDDDDHGDDGEQIRCHETATSQEDMHGAHKVY